MEGFLRVAYPSVCRVGFIGGRYQIGNHRSERFLHGNIAVRFLLWQRQHGCRYDFDLILGVQVTYPRGRRYFSASRQPSQVLLRFSEFRYAKELFLVLTLLAHDTGWHIPGHHYIRAFCVHFVNCQHFAFGRCRELCLFVQLLSCFPLLVHDVAKVFLKASVDVLQIPEFEVPLRLSTVKFPSSPRDKFVFPLMFGLI